MWLGFVGRRLLHGSVVLVGVSAVIFGALRLMPGDPLQILSGDIGGAERIEEMRRELALDRPWIIQYGAFLGRLVRGDLGRSIFTGQRVSEQIGQRLANSFSLALCSMAIAVPVGVLLGTVAAASRRTWRDGSMMAVATFGVCTPSFWLGLTLIQLFAVYLRWLPSGGGPSLRHLILPALTLAAAPTAYFARIVRGSLVEELVQDHIRTARAKGVSERSILLKHALRNASIQVVTVFGLFFGTLLGGAIITESVFSWPGLGWLLAQAVGTRDYPVVQALVMLFAAFCVLVNTLVDVLYAVLDPRVGVAHSRRV